MSIRHNASGKAMAVSLGGKASTTVFVVMLLSFVVESQLTQYVQSDLGYRQPFFLFFIVHSSFAIVLPLHLLYLRITSNEPVSSLLTDLSTTFKDQLSEGLIGSHIEKEPFPTRKLLRLVGGLTAGVTVPALLWFIAISLAPVSDVTALWNSNAFWAYIIAVRLQGLSLEPRRFASVTIASLGVMVVIYGSGNSASSDDSSPEVNGPKAPLIGNGLTLLASVGYGFYQVLYKMYAALPGDPELEESDWRRLSISSEDELVGTPIDAAPNTQIRRTPTPPFGLHPNALTSAIGLCTLLSLWIFLPILDIFALEPFRLPPDSSTYLTIFGIAFSGLAFNAAFMVLLGVWGPIVTSVGNLLTIVLVLVSDAIFGNAADTLTKWSLFGSGMIICAFGVLAYDTFNR